MKLWSPPLVPKNNDLIHNRALRAAAAAATLTVATGCSAPQTKVEETAKPEAETAAPATRPASPASESPNAPPNCDGSSGLGSDCCRAASKWCAKKFPGKDNKAHRLQDSCLYGVPGCTPWGPPAPPRYEVNACPRIAFRRNVTA